MIRPFIATGLAIAAFATMAAAPQTALLGAKPLYRTFKDWKVACDNTHACSAQPTDQSNPDEEGYLGVTREAGSRGKIVVTLNDRSPGEPTTLDLASLRIDGAPLKAALAWKFDGKDRDSAVISGGDAVWFLRALLDARTFTYRASGEERTVPLGGVKAALLAIDDNQGRVGTTTALVRPGSAAASTVPAAPPAPVLWLGPAPKPLAHPKAFTAAVRKANARLLKAAECDPGTERAAEDQAHALTDTDALVMIACSMNAHSGNTLLLRVPVADPLQARVLRLPSLPADEAAPGDDKTPTTYPFTDWDPKTASLSSAEWSCARACGETDVWTFDGRAFVPTSQYLYEPGGSAGLTVYRVEVKRKAR